MKPDSHPLNNHLRVAAPIADTARIERFDNGLILVAKELPWLHTAAFSVAVPAGCRYEPPARRGLANFACELVSRGGGGLTHRQFVDFMEGQGCLYYADTSLFHTYFGGALPAENLLPVLARYAGLILDPALPDDQLEDSRRVCFQEIQAIEDDLPERVMIALRELHYGEPDGWHAEGSLESVERIGRDDVIDFYRGNYVPQGTIIGVAGQIEWDSLRDTVAHLFGGWNTRRGLDPQQTAGEHGVRHIAFESQQTHIGLAWPGLPYRHPDYFLERAGIGVLSDGMSSRLFREVRERRGLCYTVSASCHSLLDSGCLVAYCGTTTESAQESLDVIVEQIRTLQRGISESELQRLKIQLRSSLIMRQESCRAQAGALIGDVFHLDRPRSLTELSSRIDNLSVDDVNRYWQNAEVGPFDLVTLGEQPLELRDGVSATTSR